MERRLSDLEATLEVARERLRRARRAGAERTEEMLRSAGEGVERLAARIAEVLAQR
jgi:predicted nuclease with TOPRIM domain